MNIIIDDFERASRDLILASQADPAQLVGYERLDALLVLSKSLADILSCAVKLRNKVDLAVYAGGGK